MMPVETEEQEKISSQTARIQLETSCPPSDPENAGQDTKADDKDEDIPRRLYWIDWCRTQSVWNVVFGHAWWTACDWTKFEAGHTKREWARYNDIGHGSAIYSGYGLRPTPRIWNGVLVMNGVYGDYWKRLDNGAGGYVSVVDGCTGGGESYAVGLLDAKSAMLREASNMIEYMVDTGCLHTIPLFFLIAGYVTAYTSERRNYWKNEKSELRHFENKGFLSYARRKFLRLILPWIAGTLCGVVPRYFLKGWKDEGGNDVGIIPTLLFSEMYFLYVLFAFCLVNFSFCRFVVASKDMMPGSMAKTNLGELVTVAIKNFAVHLVLVFLLPFVAFFVLMTEEERDGRILWPLCLFCCHLCIGGSLLIGCRWTERILFSIISALAQPIIWSLVLVVPDLYNETAEFNWLSVNMFVTFLLFEFAFIFGFLLQVFEKHLKKQLEQLSSINLSQVLGIFLLLTSAFWPIFTFWGERTLRRIGPWVSYYDFLQRFLGMVKAWVWMIGLLWFAKTCCNGTGSKNSNTKSALYKHATGSALCVYIFHRLFEELWLRALMDHVGEKNVDANEEDWKEPALDRFGLFISLIVLGGLSCFGVYFVLEKWWLTRRCFGIGG